MGFSSEGMGAQAREGDLVPPGLSLTMVASTTDTVHAILPPPPATAPGDEAVGTVPGGAASLGANH